MSGDSPPYDHDRVQDLIKAFLAGEQGADVRLYDLLREWIARRVVGFFNPDQGENADVVQEAIMGVFTYLRRRGRFEGDLEKFAATIAINRCIDRKRHMGIHPHVPIESFQEWMRDPHRSPLDFLEDEERNRLVHWALAELGHKCRNLLELLFFKKMSVEEYRRREGLKSVQVVYYWRNKCLRELKKILKKYL